MTPAATESGEHTSGRGYRAVWRWHFFAALWTAPLLLVLTISGAIYLFDREIDGWWNREIQTVAAGEDVLPLARQETAVLRAFPGGVPARVRLPHHREEASIWNVRTSDGKSVDVYLNPYTGIVTGTADPDLQPTTIVRDIHGNLFAGYWGSMLVELVACWTLIMLVTGVWLWWPRKWKLRGVIVPRLDTVGRRYWRDLHAIPSVINAVLVGLLVLTGLPWSAFWGEQFARLGATFPLVAPSPNFHAAPKVDGTVQSDMHAHHKHDAGEVKLPWTIRNSPTPQGTAPARISIAEVEALLPLLDRASYGEGVRVFYPRQSGDVFTISYVPDKAQGQRTIYIDPGTGLTVGNVGWRDYSPMAKAVEWGVETHVGRQYGLANQLANLAVCLVLVASVTAGLILWWRRRPQGTLGAPSTQHGERIPSGLKWLMAAIAALFPLVGATMLPVLAWQKFRPSIVASSQSA